MFVRRTIRRTAVLASSGLSMWAAIAAAGAPPDSVHWTAVITPASASSKGPAALTLKAVVDDGWHVYGLKQLEGGPTPLIVKIDPNAFADADGNISATEPEKIHDPRFDLDTQFYSNDFSVTVPLKLLNRASGAAEVPVSVRFQTCTERDCQPPKTIHLSASLNSPAQP